MSKKRESESTEAAEIYKKKIKAMSTTLLVLPGASGSLAKATKDLVDKVPGAIASSVKWNTMAPTSEKNYTTINDLIGGIEGDFVVMCNSFSNRVVLEMIKHQKLARNPKRFIFAGYPLWGPKENRDRADLLGYAKNVDCCFISGTDDEFLNRSYLKTKGKAALEQEIGDKPRYFVDRGKHSVPDCIGKSKQSQAEKVLKFMIEFINA